MSTKGKRDFRPEYHVTPENMWLNDPNGMFYRDGEWHLCYQYYPEAAHWGPMHGFGKLEVFTGCIEAGQTGDDFFRERGS